MSDLVGNHNAGCLVSRHLLGWSAAIATGSTVTFLKLLFSQILRKERKETGRLDLCQVLKCDVFHIVCPLIDTVASTHEKYVLGKNVLDHQQVFQIICL